jgi:hypothetical protein
MVRQPYCIIELYDTLHCGRADKLVERQFFLWWQDMQLVIVGAERGRQLIITKIGATVGVKPLKLFPLNKMSLNISHILHGKKAATFA